MELLIFSSLFIEHCLENLIFLLVTVDSFNSRSELLNACKTSEGSASKSELKLCF